MSHSRSKAVDVLRLVYHADSPDTQLVSGCHSRQAEDIYSRGAGVDVQDLALTVSGLYAVLSIVLDNAFTEKQGLQLHSQCVADTSKGRLTTKKLYNPAPIIGTFDSYENTGEAWTEAQWRDLTKNENMPRSLSTESPGRSIAFIWMGVAVPCVDTERGRNSGLGLKIRLLG